MEKTWIQWISINLICISILICQFCTKIQLIIVGIKNDSASNANCCTRKFLYVHIYDTLNWGTFFKAKDWKNSFSIWYQSLVGLGPFRICVHLFLHTYQAKKRKLQEFQQKLIDVTRKLKDCNLSCWNLRVLNVKIEIEICNPIQILLIPLCMPK